MQDTAKIKAHQPVTRRCVFYEQHHCYHPLPFWHSFMEFDFE
jgi:hypothetical protein